MEISQQVFFVRPCENDITEFPSIRVVAANNSTVTEGSEVWKELEAAVL